MTEKLDPRIAEHIPVLRTETGYRMHPDRINAIIKDKKIKPIEIKFFLSRDSEDLTDAEKNLLHLFRTDELSLTAPFDYELDFYASMSAIEAQREASREKQTKGRLADMFGTALDWLNTEGAQNLETVFKPIFKKLVDAGIIPPEFLDQFETSAEQAGIWGPLFQIVVVFIGFPNFIKAFTLAFLQLAEQESNAKYRPALPDLGSLLANYYKNPETRGEIKQVMDRLGLKDEHQALITDGLYTPLGIGEVQNLYWRREIGRDEAINRLKALGLERNDPEQVFKLFTLIPPIQDLIRMAVRDVWNPEAVRQLGLEEDFPEEVGEWGEKQGYSKDWLLKYWSAHWQLVGPQTAFEMFHRDVINEEELDTLLKTADYPKELRKSLLKISYNVITRVDARRMHREGILNEEDLLEVYRHQGYSPRDAQRMTEFTIRYNKQDELQISVGKILEGFRNDMLTRDDTLELIEAAGKTPEEAEYLVSLEEFDEDMRIRKLELKNLEEAYKQNLISPEDARQKLSELELDGRKQQALLNEWRLDRIKRTQKPSREMLETWYKKGLINEDRFKAELATIGWSKEYIKFIVANLA